MTPLDIYNLHRSLICHFNGQYDFFKYNGKMKPAKAGYEKLKFHYQKLSKKYGHKGREFFIELFVANIINGIEWVGDLSSIEAYNRYLDFLGKKEAVLYTFETEVLKLNISKKLFRTKNEFPEILNCYLNGTISIQTLIMLDKLMDFSTEFDKSMSDDTMWCLIRMRMKKLEPFLKYDIIQTMRILKEILDGK